MKRTVISLILALTITAFSWADTPKQPVDRSAVTAAVTDHAAYKALADRFAAGHTLSPDEIAAIYYGTALQPGFKADQSYPDIARTYAAGDYATTLSLIWNALAKDPANLYLLFTGYGAAVSLDNSEAASLLQTRLLQVCDRIFASGSGVTQDSPYVLLRPSDLDEFLVKYIQPSRIGSRAKTGDIDAVRVTIDGVPDEIILYFRQF